MTARARFCIRCGRALTRVVEEGRPRQRCPRCGWTFYNNPVPAAVALVTGPRGVLLARRARAPYRGTWDLPGGFLEAGEVPEAGLKRELEEELGTPARIGRFVGGFTERYGRRGFQVLALVYTARLQREPVAQSDVAEVRWFPLDRIPWREIEFPSVRLALRRFRASRGR